MSGTAPGSVTSIASFAAPPFAVAASFSSKAARIELFSALSC